MVLPLFSSLSIPYMQPTTLFRSQGYTPWHFGVPEAMQSVDVPAMFVGQQVQPQCPIDSQATQMTNSSYQFQPMLNGSAKVAPVLGGTVDVSR